MPKKVKLDFDDMVVGTRLPSNRRGDIPQPPPGLSGIDLHLAQLHALHPQLKVKFRSEELKEMSLAEKKLLLEDINAVLGITNV